MPTAPHPGRRGRTRPRGAPSAPTRAAAAVFASLVLLTAPAPARAETTDGIDVSHWQGKIRWSRVAAAGVRFALIKATDGPRFVDPRYAGNRAGARASGIVSGAYHFARPKRALRSAIRQADRFVDTARLRTGDLVPVLDIEEDGGLSTRRLQDWTKRFLARVRARTGLRATIYAGPNFWREHMGDTTMFADRGHRLWIAHWFVEAPSVPANDWQGRSWSIWQWTNCRRVAGIGGCVDGDRVPGTRLLALRIPRLRVSVVGDGRVTSLPAGIACRGDEVCDSWFDPGTEVVLRAAADGSAFVRWRGDCAGTDPSCTVTALGRPTVRAVFEATS